MATFRDSFYDINRVVTKKFYDWPLTQSTKLISVIMSHCVVNLLQHSSLTALPSLLWS